MNCIWFLVILLSASIRNCSWNYGSINISMQQSFCENGILCETSNVPHFLCLKRKFWQRFYCYCLKWHRFNIITQKRDRIITLKPNISYLKNFAIFNACVMHMFSEIVVVTTNLKNVKRSFFILHQNSNLN